MVFSAMVPAAIVFLLTPLIGRVFCGYICPMGTTLDFGGKIFGFREKAPPQGGRLLSLKYLLLVFIFGAAILGVSLVFLAAPLSLITRFYGLLIHSILAHLLDMGLNLLRPLADKWDMTTISMAQIKPPRFSTQYFILIFFGCLFILSGLSLRLWCRYLCPTGALLALLSKKPVVRRRVSDVCTACGACQKSCPMKAIPDDSPESTRYRECIVCHTCRKICPVNAITFSVTPRKNKGHSEGQSIMIPRRAFLQAGVAGVATASVSLSGLNSLYGKPGPGQVPVPGLIRPPASLPEMDFLSRCVRCGECISVCPTNTLQPIWFKGGFIGLFSPAITPRRGFCNPECHQCAAVCPTGAISKLSKDERLWAKTGTAVILRERCLAWEHQKSCMVCDEVCPFKAVEFNFQPKNPVPVPRVREDRCAGCGYCEHYCPVQNRAAIIVSAMSAIRLTRGSYRAQGELQGLKLALKPKGDAGAPYPETPLTEGPAPGFTDD
ncbi:MAG: 4Fe-4S binding protein [Deltaproteobacteria bacterium]|nr:4Fe-4S binding protein [Deltaproteobacteria bacterium]